MKRTLDLFCIVCVQKVLSFSYWLSKYIKETTGLKVSIILWCESANYPFHKTQISCNGHKTEFWLFCGTPRCKQ